jgi:phosphopantetheinyl transferase
MDTGTCVWYCDIGEIASLISPEWNAYLSLLSPIEVDRVLKYRYDDDRRRALVSALLQRWLVRNKLGMDNDDSFEILRTPENKPYAKVKRGSQASSLSFWNFNLSHHGRFVGLASHANRVIGVDIVDLSTRATIVNNARDYAYLFRAQLHPDELEAILAQPTEQAAYTLFFVIWSLKESFIKAIGLGMGYDLKMICFSVYYQSGPGGPPLSPLTMATAMAFGTSSSANTSLDSGSTPGIGDENRTSLLVVESICGYATARIDGVERALFREGPYCSAAGPSPPGSADLWPDPSHPGLWSFDFFSLDDRHVVSVALGPLADCIPSYRRLAWGVDAVAVDAIPRATRRPLPQGVAISATAQHALSIADLDAVPESQVYMQQAQQESFRPPSPTEVDALGKLSNENAAHLVEEVVNQVVHPNTLLKATLSMDVPKGRRVTLRSLLPLAGLRAMPDSLPTSPPATELNNRYDSSVLIDDYRDLPNPTGGDVFGETPLSPGVAHLPESSRSAPLQQSTPQLLLQRKDASLSVLGPHADPLEDRDWKQLPLPTRCAPRLTGVASRVRDLSLATSLSSSLGGERDDCIHDDDFHSPADWRAGRSRERLYTPTAEEVNEMLRVDKEKAQEKEQKQELICGAFVLECRDAAAPMERQDLSRKDHSRSGSGSAAADEAQCMCVIM